MMREDFINRRLAIVTLALWLTIALLIVHACRATEPAPPNPIERMLTGEVVAEEWFREFMRRVRAGEDPGAVADDLIARGLIVPELRTLLVNSVAPRLVYPTEPFPPDPTIEATTVPIGTMQALLPPAIRDADANRDNVVTREEYDAWTARTWKALLDRRKTWWTGAK